VFRWRDGIVDGYSTADGLTNDVVRSLLVDRGGQVWIGTDTGGLTRLKPRRAHNFPLPGRADASIGPIVDDGDGGLWVGATCGGLLHFREGAFRVYDRSAGLPHECVWALHRDPDGTLWIGTMGGGLARLRHGVFSTFNASPATALVHAIKRDRAGRLWVGANNGLNLFDNGRFTTFVPDPAFPDVSTIAEDHTGALWLGGRHGVRRFKDGRVTATYTTADGLSHNQVRAIHEDADGALWIGTYGGGLNRLQDGHITTYGLDEGLPDVAVSRIIEDERGDLWMSGNRGVYRVARRQLNDLAAGRITKVTSVTYGTADGMVIEETNGGQPAGWRTADGHFWFPTIKGLVRIDAGPTAAPRPPTFIERASVNGAEVAVAALGALGPGRTDAEIHFTAVDLGAAEKTRFRYRLHPYDPDWIQAGTRRVAYYTQIPPGRYRFEVEATDSDGAWSGAPAVVPLVVVPRWWQRLELQTAGALALLAATGFGARAVSLRRARARFSALERERALDRERTRIARDLHDELGSQLTRIALIASRGDGEQRSPVAQAVQDAVRTMGELVWSVDARRDSVDSFATYAAQFAEQHLEAAGIRCRLNIDPDLGDRELHADMRRNLFLAFKEALNNAVRHARASQVTVTIASTGDVLTVAVTDDGRGLPGQADGTREDGSRGNGLDNMRARIESLGGDVRLGAPPGGGTQVTFRLFLRQPRSSHPKM
jgi:signal transduction histidine kinase/streptogramin lyase